MLIPRLQRQEDSGGAKRVIGEARRTWHERKRIQIRDTAHPITYEVLGISLEA